NMEHGKFPVPPPAVAELLQGIPVYSTEIEGELITPTGAAIISTLCESYGPMPEIKVEQTGYGAGTRTYDGFPNVLRLFLGEAIAASIPAEGTLSETLFVLETNVDDASPQVLGFLMERSFEIGALDCWFTPVMMKKDRPATVVSVLCREEARGALTELIFRETTSIGVRVRQVERESLVREEKTVPTAYGTISVKTSFLAGEPVNVMPEYDDVAAAARSAEVPFKMVWVAALAAAQDVKAATA